MIRFIFLITFSHIILSQYVLGKGIYLSIGGSYDFNTISETETQTDLTTKYSGSGPAFDIGFVIKFDRRNSLIAEFGQRKLEISHNSSLLADSALVSSGSIKQKMQFNTFQLQYFKKFEQNPLFIGGGGGARFPADFTGNDYIQNIVEQSYGLGTIGLEFSDNSYSIISYMTYAFPITKLKKNDLLTAQMGELYIGLKILVKLF